MNTSLRLVPVPIQNNQTLFRNFLFVVTALFVYPVSVSATPSVSGLTISVPDDGWYQIQSATNYSTVCEGVTSCTVVPGKYIVINHSSGDRFENVLVSAGVSNPGSTNAMGEVVVEGSKIRWPDNGWYQVQSASDYRTVCEGGRSCEVSAGRYIVINHDTGQRFEGIEVDSQNASGDSAISGTGNSLTLSGSTLSWQGDDWYQIQSASDYATVCEGGNSCVLNNGVYNIINHSNGSRIDNVVVDGTSLDPDANQATNDGTSPTGDNTAGLASAPVLGNTAFYLSHDDGFSAPRVETSNYYRSIAQYIGDLDGNGSFDYFYHEGEYRSCSDLVIQVTAGPSERGRTSAGQVRIGAHLSDDDTCNKVDLIDSNTDMNGDGIIDLVVGGFEYVVSESNINPYQDYIGIFYGPFEPGRFLVNELDGNNGFVIRDVGNVRDTRSVGDVNGDGIGDLIIEHAGFFELSEPTLVQVSVPGVPSVDAYEYLLENELGRESGNFNSYLNQPALGDVDGDGHLDDYVLAGCTGYIVYGDGRELPDSYDFSAMATAGRLTQIDLSLSPCAAGEARRIIDVDGDGLPDSIVAGSLLLSSSGSRLADAHFLDLSPSTGLEFANTLDESLGRTNYDSSGFQLIGPTSLWPAVWNNNSLFVNYFDPDSGEVESQLWGDQCGPQDLVVKQGPDEWQILWDSPVCETSVSRYQLTINGETYDVEPAQQQFSMTGEMLSEGGSVRIASVTSAGDINPSPTRTLAAWRSPTFLDTEMNVNVWSSSFVEVDMGYAPGWTFTKFLIHRNDELVATPPAGQQSIQDEDVIPDTTYTYWQTINYFNFDVNSDLSVLNRYPRVQWQGNKVTVTTPEL